MSPRGSLKKAFCSGGDTTHQATLNINSVSETPHKVRRRVSATDTEGRSRRVKVIYSGRDPVMGRAARAGVLQRCRLLAMSID